MVPPVLGLISQLTMLNVKDDWGGDSAGWEDPGPFSGIVEDSCRSGVCACFDFASSWSSTLLINPLSNRWP